MNKRQAQRLLNVARALRESEHPELFTMESYVNNAAMLSNRFEATDVPEHWCGTPACALGHYGARTDLQRKIRIARIPFGFNGTSYFGLRYGNNRDVGYADDAMLNHFGLERHEAHLLFCPSGCGGAKTTLQAAQFIENFVAQKYGTVS
jgi:hypothetical protein